MVSKREAIMYCTECAAAGKDVPKKGLGNSAYCPDCGGKKFIKKYGLEEFKKIAKLHFANFKELMNDLA